MKKKPLKRRLLPHKQQALTRLNPARQRLIKPIKGVPAP